MTDYNQPPLVTSPYMEAPPRPPVKRTPWFRKPVVLIAAGALLLGFGVGTAGTPEPETVEVIKEVEVPGPERILTKEVKVNVPTTPPSCLTAITLYETAMDQLSTSLGHILDGDYAAAGASTDKVGALVPKVNAAKSECRAAR